MTVRVNQCVDCQLPCIGSFCTLANVEVVVCDVCGNPAEYRIDHRDYCKKHASEYVEEMWNSLSLLEKAEALDLGGDVI